MKWRVYSFISLVSQIVRIPLFISFVEDVSDLNEYFIITSLSLPIFFLSSEFLLFSSLNFKDLKSTVTMSIILLITFIFVGTNYNSLLYHYLIYSGGILFYSTVIGRLRDSIPFYKILKIECFYQFLITGTSIAVIYNSKSIDLIGLNLITVFSILSICTGIFIIMNHKKSFTSKTSKNRIDYKGNSLIVLIIILFITQIERIIITKFDPSIIAHISLSAAAVLGLRKISFDDSYVFDEMNVSVNQAESILTKLMKRTRVFFYSIGAVLLILNAFIPSIIALIHRLGILSGFKETDFYSSFKISLLYVFSMPSSIVIINYIRRFEVPLSFNLFIPIILTITAEMLFLLNYSKTLTLNYIGLIAITSGFNILLLFSTIFSRYSKLNRGLYLDIIVFISISLLMLWI